MECLGTLAKRRSLAHILFMLNLEMAAKLAQLKDQVMHGKDFHKTFSYFFDHLGENEEFIGPGTSEPATSEVLRSVLEKTALSYLKKDRLEMQNLVMLKARGSAFYHGGFAAAGGMFTFLFFEDVGMGLLAIARLGQPGTHFIRMSCQVVGTGPLFN
jgi:hypothetical protein